MSGNRFLLDTNAIIALLKGNKKVISTLSTAEWIGISVISQLEFLSFPKLSEADECLFLKLIDRVDIVNIDSSDKPLIQQTLDIRRKNNLKLPDAIIAATAINHSAILISNDKRFATIKRLHVIPFENK